MALKPSPSATGARRTAHVEHNARAEQNARTDHDARTERNARTKCTAGARGSTRFVLLLACAFAACAGALVACGQSGADALAPFPGDGAGAFGSSSPVEICRGSARIVPPAEGISDAGPGSVSGTQVWTPPHLS